MGSSTTLLVSVNSLNVQGNANSAPFSKPAISDDGSVAAFASYANNLVSGDGNSVRDVFVRDRTARATTLVSKSSAGILGNGESGGPSLSSDGRFVAFDSEASNLVAGDSNGVSDVFVHDRLTGQTTRVSVSSAGAEGNGSSTAPSISANGRYIAFQTFASNILTGDTNDALDAVVHDRKIGTSLRASANDAGVQGNGHSEAPVLSADARFVAFQSRASNLDPADSNSAQDAFRHGLPVAVGPTPAEIITPLIWLILED